MIIATTSLEEIYKNKRLVFYEGKAGKAENSIKKNLLYLSGKTTEPSECAEYGGIIVQIHLFVNQNVLVLPRHNGHQIKALEISHLLSNKTIGKKSDRTLTQI